MTPSHKNLRSLAEEAFGRRDFTEAEKLFRQVITYLELALGDDHVEVAKTLGCLARALEEGGRHDEAKIARERAERILCTH